MHAGMTGVDVLRLSRISAAQVAAFYDAEARGADNDERTRAFRPPGLQEAASAVFFRRALISAAHQPREALPQRFRGDWFVHDLEAARGNFRNAFPGGVTCEDDSGQIAPRAPYDLLRRFHPGYACSEVLVGHDGADPPAFVFRHTQRFLSSRRR